MKLPQNLHARWRNIARREQQLLLAALVLVLAALLWWIGVAPALATLRSADKQNALLSAQLQQMQQLQMQAKTIQAQPPLTVPETRRLLEASVKPLGAAVQLVVAGERVTLTMQGVAADALTQWLTQARLNARAAPSEARLTRNAAGTWDGTLVLNLK